MSFIDRINLHFKLGARALVPFTEEEMTYVRAVDEADTFDKVCLTAAMLRDYLNAKRQENEDGETSSSTSGSGQQDGQGESNSTEGEGEDETGDNKSSAMKSDSDGDGDDKQESPEGSTTAGGGRVSEMTAETQHQFDSQMEDLAKPTGYGAEVVLHSERQT